METLEGAVRRVVFTAPDGAFAVVRLDVPGRAAPVTVIGPIGEASAGEQLKLEGTWERHAVHGEQFRAARAVVEVPRSDDGVRRYLEGLTGIGPEIARRLVAAFGVRAVEVLEEEPWRAAQVKGMGKRRAETVAIEAAARKRQREIMIFLQGLGVSLAYATRIHKVYGDQAAARVRENPYRLARDVPGIGFQIADKIARGMGYALDSPERIGAGLLHVLDELSGEGHVYAPRGELVRRAAASLGAGATAAGVAPLDEARVSSELEALIGQGAVVVEQDAIFSPPLHRAECEIAAGITRLLAAERGPAPRLRPEEGARLSQAQRQAVDLVAEAAVVVITGGPGTGKTTVVRALVGAWERARRRVLLAAPTGRAAQRLKEATGRPAQTVHRLLEWGRPGARRGPFARDRQNPLPAELLVVDEASMLDVHLARGVLEALAPGATLVLVGDVDQLPSVGPGRVLGDLIDSRALPVARLNEVFRQAEGSGIIENAYRILHGELPVGAPAGGSGGEFYIVSVDDPDRARELVVKLCQERIPQRFGLDGRRDVQVLAPMHRGAAGTEELNRALQAALNPAGDAVEHGGRVLRVGDKVMQLKNDYERDVFNGDLGVITAAQSVDEAPVVDVSFDGRPARYQGDALWALELAYAITVHKSQGSEYPAVVVPLQGQHFVMLRRNLLYTAVTRGKRLVVLVASPRALKRAVEEAAVELRHTRLAERLAAPVVS